MFVNTVESECRGRATPASKSSSQGRTDCVFEIQAKASDNAKVCVCALSYSDAKRCRLMFITTQSSTSFAIAF